MQKLSKVLKEGGKVVCYGMTSGSKITFKMQQVLKNQQLIGSTMGSVEDLSDATAFVNRQKIVPIISHIFDGLESAEQGFEVVEKGEQFGKVVIKLLPPGQAKL